MARTRLLAAAELGPPRYTEGLRLLFEGLRTLSGTDAHDKSVGRALEHVRVFASACDWTAVTAGMASYVAKQVTRGRCDPRLQDR